MRDRGARGAPDRRALQGRVAKLGGEQGERGAAGVGPPHSTSKDRASLIKASRLAAAKRQASITGERAEGQGYRNGPRIAPDEPPSSLPALIPALFLGEGGDDG